MKNLLKEIPQVAKILKEEAVLRETASFSYPALKGIINQVLAELKEKIRNKEIQELSYDFVLEEIMNRLKTEQVYQLHAVLNGTGTILHTNLGRAVFDEEVIAHVSDIMRSYTNLELDLVTGKRSSRLDHLKNAICALTGAEDYLLVNNNAAAVTLIINTFSKNETVLISRGELVEIGEGFRMLDLIQSAGAHVVEVGATNRTEVEDYKQALKRDQTVIYKIHPSNFLMEGYVEACSVKDLAELAPVFYDLGAGVLNTDQAKDSVKQALKDGASLCSISGDKLLGGPQVGIIFGKKEFINKLKQNHYYRALRVDKLRIAALEATYLRLLKNEPSKTFEMWNKPVDVLTKEANKVRDLGIPCQIVQIQKELGGGTTPGLKKESVGLMFTGNPETILNEFRSLSTPIIGRVQDGQALIDLSTITDFVRLKEVLVEWKG